MGQVSHNYVERAKELLDRSAGSIGPPADDAIARAQVNATLAVSAELHELNRLLAPILSNHTRAANGDAPLTKEQ